MRLLKRVFVAAIVIVLVLIVVGAGGGYWFATKGFPQIDGTLRVPGLKNQVEIVRDRMGVPHIYAGSADDLLFAQGYVQAQDRLWQMEFNRRIGSGTLSDVLGAAAIKQDRFLRTIGLARAARADLAAASNEDTRRLQAFAYGVNAFVDSHLDNLPIEFTILGFKPGAWEPVDTLAWGKVMAMNLSGNYEADLLRSSLLDTFGADKTRELMPAYPSSGPSIISPDMKEFKSPSASIDPDVPHVSIGSPTVDLSEIQSYFGFRSPDLGSNNWVIDGSKSTTGKPILANDPHLGIQMPSIWYEMGLHCVPVSALCPYDVAGFTFPGVPGIVVGHNNRIAWGVTNVGPDVQDLYVEKINPQNPNQYEYQGKWQDMQIVDEPIRVKGVVSETLHVQITRHGPVMTPVLSGVTQTVALQWTALKERSTLMRSVDMIDRAQNWDELRAALRFWDVPSQNFVYADVDGNIGYQMPGNVPIRAKGDGSLPVPGWSGEYEWNGYIPFDELPSVFNPKTHVIATANNAVVPLTYQYHLSSDWAAPYRAQRIMDLLRAKDKLSVNDFKEIQGDVYSIPLAQVQKYILTINPEGFLQQRAMQHVRSWDGRLTVDTVGGTIVEVTYQKMFSNLFANKMSKEMFAAYQAQDNTARLAVLALLQQPDSEWWDISSTPNKETRDDILKVSYDQATDWLGSQFGDAPEEWRWGRLHTATFAHPLGSVQPLDRLFNAGPIAAPGGVFTVFATSFKSTAPYAVSSVSSMRQILDLANWDNAVTVHMTGQSGQPLSRHYADMVTMWRDVQYAPFYFSRQAIDRAREGRLVLTPSQ